MQRVKRIAAALTAVLIAAGCNDTRDLAPAAPDTPWPIPPSSVPSASEVAPVSAPVTRAAIEPAHRYSLVELIDIAEHRNQTTRIAWEQARQAAINVGITKAAFLPILTAS
ncbi:MAG: TolC family protein, partial [Acidisphaera sp.]|nr:TolC family protein [Acidisphaera sp.]